ncbi:PAS domain-containing sensor histidine kinase [Thiomicrorhabdus indica]|uniref:PAS domain-containing sensor histidine kinase n=1 Tax=Thiomicrorhabdus indica TaxID=2267253 RepID=UPI00102D75E9|nr:PAS domain-containing sensor histidine kinase [Thiomicrorhabdus indica]
MEFIKKQKFYAFSVLFLSTLLICILIWLNHSSLKLQQQSVQSWKQYSENELKITESLNTLHQTLGYEGFIHHYKNYLIRQTPGDLAQLRLDIRNVKNALRNLEQLLNHPDELVALDQLNYIFGRYVGYVDEMERLIAKNTPVQTIDRLVKINEPTATLALEMLNESIKRRLKAAQENNQAQLDKSLSLSVLNYILMLPIVGMMFYILYMFKKSQSLIEQAHQSNTKLTQLFNTTPDPTLFIDVTGNIVRINNKALDYFGFSKQQLLQMNIKYLLGDNFIRPILDNLSNSMDPKDLPDGLINEGHPIKIKLANEQTSSVQVQLSCWQDHEDILIIASIRDVSKELEDREKLRESSRELAASMQKLQHITHHLAESEKMAALGTLVAGVSHEINTPLGVSLTAITHMSDQLQNTKSDFVNDNLTFEQLEEHLNGQLETAQLITRNLEQAANLINNFKQVAIDQTQTEFREFQLCAYIDDTLTSLKPSFKHKSIQVRFDCDSDTAMLSYPGALSQIINNLVMNAVNHAFESHSTNVITLQTLVDLPQNQVILRISDNGCGMSAEVQKHIFEPFYTTARSNGGSGLGLNIVYNLVTQLLQGDIRVESEPDHGTDVFIILPQKIEKRQNTDSQDALLSDLKQPKIDPNKVARKPLESGGRQ